MINKTGISILDNLPLWDGVTGFSPELSRKLCQALGAPQNSYKTVHVAGTNGKGTVCSYVAAMLAANGERVGQFASPHLSRINERCLIAGRPIAFDKFTSYVEEAWDTAQREDLKPSYFELCTAATFLAFAREGVSSAVIEVGLGGRLDATNVLAAPELTVITSIGYDHMHFLGETLSQIAKEKAGIAKSQVPLLVGEVGEEAREAISEVTTEVGAEVKFRAGRNVSLAIAIGEELGLSDKAILSGIENARWPGRMERVGRVLMDVAHNPAGIELLLSELQSEESKEKFKKITFAVAVLQRKAWREMLDQLKGFSRDFEERGGEVEFLWTEPGHHLATPATELQKYFGSGKVVDVVSLSSEELSEEELLVVTGSIYLVGELRPLLCGDEFRTIAQI